MYDFYNNFYTWCLIPRKIEIMVENKWYLIRTYTLKIQLIDLNVYIIKVLGLKSNNN